MPYNVPGHSGRDADGGQMIEPLEHAHLAFRGSKLAFFFFFFHHEIDSPR